MKIFTAGNVGIITREIQYRRLFRGRLLSFYEIINNLFASDESFNLITKRNRNMPEGRKRVELFLDSGAFSAWSQGKEINIEDYIQFIKEHKDVIDVYANLDVIGDAEATWRNQLRMEKAGLNPLPVFHYGEDISWLKNLLKHK